MFKEQLPNQMKLYFFILLLVTEFSVAQKLDANKDYYFSAIGFWNVENLYDTLNDLRKNDDDFTLNGTYQWSGERYWTKIERLATVIGQIATDVTPDGLALIGLCEVENSSVLIDLIQSSHLRKRNYQYILIEGPDIRGVDPALMYNPNYFVVTRACSYKISLVTDSTHKTRDILVVSGTFLGEELAVIVNHWPSRRGGELMSRANRNAAAKVAKHIADSILNTNSGCKLIIMGDLNDDPTNESVKKYLGTFSDLRKPLEGKFFNPMEKLYKKGIGTLAWQDSWNLFDQLILNKPWFPTDFKTWQYYSVRVFNKEFLRADFGNFKGYPFRTYSSGVYTGGYSDHFPSYIIVAKRKN